MIEDYQNAGIESGWHHWDARLKLFLSVAAIALNVIIAEAWLSFVLLLISLVFIAYSKIPSRLFAIFFLAPAWATALVFVGFSVGFGTQELWSVGPITVYREGMELGLSAALRVASEMSWIATLMLTTPFTQLLAALTFYRVPSPIVDAIGMAYRYAFLMADECYRMMAAARVRGGLKNFYGKIESLSMVLAQVIIRAYDRAARVQEAMVARGANFAHKTGGDVILTIEPGIAEAPSTSPERHYDCLLPAIESSGSAAILECRALSFAYKRGGATEIDKLDLTVVPGEVIVLCGPNGCGKSTLLRLIVGALKPLSGAIHLLKRPLDPARRNEAFRYAGLLFQDPNDQVFCTHVREDVGYGPRNLGLEPQAVDTLVDAAMALAEITHLAGRSVHQLSFGEMKRIGLAGLIAMRPPLMLLDEPSAYLDPAASQQLMRIVRRLNIEYGYTFILATHDMELAAELASRVLVMMNGRIVADGKPREILANEKLLQSARLEPPTLIKLFSEIGTAGDADVPLTVSEAKALFGRLKASS
jgi:cobalt ECF transporter T component CbiQ